MLPSTFQWVLVQNFIMWSFLTFWLCSKMYTISYCAVYIVYLYFFRVSKAVRLYSTHFNCNSGFQLLPSWFFLCVENSRPIKQRGRRCEKSQASITSSSPTALEGRSSWVHWIVGYTSPRFKLSFIKSAFCANYTAIQRFEVSSIFSFFSHLIDQRWQHL